MLRLVCRSFSASFVFDFVLKIYEVLNGKPHTNFMINLERWNFNPFLTRSLTMQFVLTSELYSAVNNCHTSIMVVKRLMANN